MKPDPTLSLTLFVALSLLARKDSSLAPEAQQQLQEGLTLAGVGLALLHQPQEPDNDTPYQERVNTALTLSLEEAASTLCSRQVPFPQNVWQYLLQHAEAVEPDVPESPAPAADSVSGDAPAPEKQAHRPRTLSTALAALAQRAGQAGETLLYHPRFPSAFAAQVAAKALFEVEPYLREYTRQAGVYLDADFTYLADVLQEAGAAYPAATDRLARGQRWLNEQAAAAAPAPHGAAGLKWKGSLVDLLEVAYALQAANFLTSADVPLSADQQVATFAGLFGRKVVNPRNHLAGRIRRTSHSPASTLKKILTEYLKTLQAQADAPSPKPLAKNV